jgi:hypothetical protein
MQDQKLKDYFKFDDADLQANRDSQLSEKQKNEILKRRKDWKKSGINYSLAMIAIGLGIVLIDAVISYMRDPQLHLDTGALITAGMLVLLGFLLLYFTLTSESGKTDILEDVVKKAKGPVNIIKAEGTRTSGGKQATSTLEHYFAYELHIGGKEFDVDESLTNLIMQKDEYAVYYDDRNGRILPAEFVSNAK